MVFKCLWVLAQLLKTPSTFGQSVEQSPSLGLSGAGVIYPIPRSSFQTQAHQTSCFRFQSRSPQTHSHALVQHPDGRIKVHKSRRLHLPFDIRLLHGLRPTVQETNLLASLSRFYESLEWIDSPHPLRVE